MGNTPNNNFPYPEATGLVKDGWEDIKDLATSIDTKLGVYGAAGLVKINTTTFSAVSSQSINDVFSATYKNYKILIDTDASDADTALNMRMRVSGSDNSSSNYRWSTGYVAMSGAANIAGQNGAGLGTSFRVMAIANAGRNVASLDFFNPFTAEETQYVGNYQQISTLNYSQFVGGNTSVTTSYTGFTLIPAAGTITGSVTVMGYNA